MNWWRRLRHRYMSWRQTAVGARAVALPAAVIALAAHAAIVTAYFVAMRDAPIWISDPPWSTVITRVLLALGAPAVLGYLWHQSPPSRRVVRVGDWFGAGILAHSIIWIGGAMIEFVQIDRLNVLGMVVLPYSLIMWGVAGAFLLIQGTVKLSRELSSERLERRRLEALMEFTRRITSLNYQTILNEAVIQLYELLEADACALYLWSEDEQVLTPVAGKHDPDVYTASYVHRMMTFRCPLGFGVTGWVMQTGLPYISGDMSSDPRSQELPGWSVNDKSCLIAPIQVEGRRLGVVRLTRRGLHQFTADDLDLVLSFAGQAALVIEHGRIVKELSELSITDSMTGLYNARHFNQVIGAELNRAERRGAPLALIMVDSDSLKEFNDRMGHRRGDEYIRMIGRVLRKVIRLSDHAFRYAGDEFLVVLPGAGRETALLVAERIRNTMEDAETQEHGIGGTVSMGVAIYPDHGADSESLLSMADRALYESKRRGKNCVTLADVVLSHPEALQEWGDSGR